MQECKICNMQEYKMYNICKSTKNEKYKNAKHITKCKNTKYITNTRITTVSLSMSSIILSKNVTTLLCLFLFILSFYEPLRNGPWSTSGSWITG